MFPGNIWTNSAEVLLENSLQFGKCSERVSSANAAAAVNRTVVVKYLKLLVITCLDITWSKLKQSQRVGKLKMKLIESGLSWLANLVDRFKLVIASFS